jgi:DDE family transposase
MGSAKATGARRPRSRDTVHGHQQLSLFNAHYDERCFLPIHIYEALDIDDTWASGKPVAMILRAGKTPSGEEVRTVLKHVIKRIRRWPKVHILVRGDSHYGRDEAMQWCEETPGVDYVFGFAGNDVLHAHTREAAAAIAVLRAASGEDKTARLQGLSLRRKELSRRQFA